MGKKAANVGSSAPAPRNNLSVIMVWWQGSARNQHGTSAHHVSLQSSTNIGYHVQHDAMLQLASNQNGTLRCNATPKEVWDMVSNWRGGKTFYQFLLHQSNHANHFSPVLPDERTWCMCPWPGPLDLRLQQDDPLGRTIKTEMDWVGLVSMAHDHNLVTWFWQI